MNKVSVSLKLLGDVEFDEFRNFQDKNSREYLCLSESENGIPINTFYIDAYSGRSH